MNSLGRILLLAALTSSTSLIAASLEVVVQDGKGAPVTDAVVYAIGNARGAAAKPVIIDQRDKQFVPYVTALQVGTAVVFPNSDNIRHHVYSFSPAKRFELPLYSGIPAEPVTFDKEGFVTLGCNIHDWMVAYVAVLPTPHFQVTGQDGRAVLHDLPPGSYNVLAWQPALKGAPEKFAQHVEVPIAKELLFNLDLKPDFRVQRTPALSSGGYR
ncbi:MAG TPA: methylamine utilization protein [Chthoniobacterales bacterium]